MKTTYHRTEKEWLRTSTGEKRGYIDPERLRELWFHTGTVCNLQCPDCFEFSAPGDHRLESLTFYDARPVIDEATDLGIDTFSFTGGEPFMVRDTVRILDYALDFRPCLVLTNGTQPLISQLNEVVLLRGKPHPLSFRVSLDYPDEQKHDALRGDGMFEMALNTLGQLYRAGFHVSVARRWNEGEDLNAVSAAYQPFFAAAGLPADTPLIAFPNFQLEEMPDITETCMTTYHNQESRGKFMCAFSRMAVKQKTGMRFYACTLVDDNPYYNLESLLRKQQSFVFI